jgi:hypothetical protein
VLAPKEAEGAKAAAGAAKKSVASASFMFDYSYIDKEV